MLYVAPLPLDQLHPEDPEVVKLQKNKEGKDEDRTYQASDIDESLGLGSARKCSFESCEDQKSQNPAGGIVDQIGDVKRANFQDVLRYFHPKTCEEKQSHLSSETPLLPQNPRIKAKRDEDEDIQQGFIPVDRRAIEHRFPERNQVDGPLHPVMVGAEVKLQHDDPIERNQVN